MGVKVLVQYVLLKSRSVLNVSTIQAECYEGLDNIKFGEIVENDCEGAEKISDADLLGSRPDDTPNHSETQPLAESHNSDPTQTDEQTVAYTFGFDEQGIFNPSQLTNAEWAALTPSGVTLSLDQRRMVMYNKTLFLQGRSGTGKTLVIITSIVFKQLQNAGSSHSGKKVLFVTYSSALCRWVQTELQAISNRLREILPERFPHGFIRNVYCMTWKDLAGTAYTIDFYAFEKDFWNSSKIPIPAKESKLNPFLVWAEINTVIRGKPQTLSLEDYIQNSSAAHGVQLTNIEKQAIYKTFISYHEGFKRGLLGHHHRGRRNDRDEVDVASLRSADRYDYVMVDEVQDFIPAQLSAVMLACTDANGFTFAGDTCQTINPGCAFSFDNLRDMFHSRFSVRPKMFTLSTNFRSRSGVVNIANRLVKLLGETFPLSVDQLRESEGQDKSVLKKPLSESSLFEEKSGQEGPIARVIKIENSAQGLYSCFAGKMYTEEKFVVDRLVAFVIVRDDEARKIVAKYLDGTILTPLEAKGLECDQVLVLNFFSTKDAGHHWNIANGNSGVGHLLRSINSDSSLIKGLNKKQRESIQNIFPAIHEVKQLYVALTRARTACTIIQEASTYHKCQHFQEYCKDVLHSSASTGHHSPITVLLPVTEMNQIERIQSLFDAGERLLQHACDDEQKRYKVFKEARKCFEQAEADSALCSREDLKELLDKLDQRKLFSLASYSRTKACFDSSKTIEERISLFEAAAKLYLQISDMKSAFLCFKSAVNMVHERCFGEERIVLEKQIWKAAAEVYLEIGNLTFAGQSYESLANLSKNRDDYMHSGLCFLLLKTVRSIRHALALFLEGGLFLFAGACVENSELIPEIFELKMEEGDLYIYKHSIVSDLESAQQPHNLDALIRVSTYVNRADITHEIMLKGIAFLNLKANRDKMRNQKAKSFYMIGLSQTYLLVRSLESNQGTKSDIVLLATTLNFIVDRLAFLASFESQDSLIKEICSHAADGENNDITLQDLRSKLVEKYGTCFANMLPSSAEIECRGYPGQSSTESELLLQQIGCWYKSACESALVLIFFEEDKEWQTRDEAKQEKQHTSFHEQGISILCRLFSLSASLLSKTAPTVFPLLGPVLECMHPTLKTEKTCTDFSVIDFMLLGSYQIPEHEGKNINPDSHFSSYSDHQLNMSDLSLKTMSWQCLNSTKSNEQEACTIQPFREESKCLGKNLEGKEIEQNPIGNTQEEAQSNEFGVKLWQLLYKFKYPATSSESSGGLSDHLRCHMLLEGLNHACSISAAASRMSCSHSTDQVQEPDKAGLVVAGIEAVLGLPDASIRLGCVRDIPEVRAVLETMRTALQSACRHGRDQQVPVGLEARLLSLLNAIAGHQ
jgi:superfamily I DNA/RNA helicase